MSLVRRRREPDPAVRAAVVAISAGRLGIGIGALFATGPALRALGFPDPDAPARALARLAGGRDIALGLAAIAAADDRAALRQASLAAAGVDIGDAIGLGLAGARDRRLRRAGLIGAVAGLSAGATGLWAASRLG